MRKIRKQEKTENNYSFNDDSIYHDYADIYAHDFFLGKDPGSI